MSLVSLRRKTGSEIIALDPHYIDNISQDRNMF